MLDDCHGGGILGWLDVVAANVEVSGNGGTGILAKRSVELYGNVSPIKVNNNKGYGIQIEVGGVQIEGLGGTHQITGNKGMGIYSLGPVDIRSNTEVSNNHGWGIVGGSVSLKDSRTPAQTIKINNNGNGEECWFAVDIGEGEPATASFKAQDCSGGGVAAGTGNLVATNIEVKENGSDGITTLKADSKTDLRGVYILNNKGDGANLTGSLTYVQGEVCGNQGDGIVVVGGTADLQGVKVCQNGGIGIKVTTPSPGNSTAWARSVSKDTLFASVVRGSMIIANTGGGVHYESSTSLTVIQNNIVGNSEFGLNNLNPSVTVNAQNNWWGAASGPGGSGPGAGDGVIGQVDFSNWRSAIMELSVSAGSDLVLASAGLAGSAMVYVQNWVNASDTVNITVTDSQGWLLVPATFTLNLENGTGSAEIKFAVPVDAPVGTTDEVTINGVSATSPTASDADSFLVTVIPTANLSLTKADELDPVAVGEDITYRLEVTNSGPNDATGVSVTDLLPQAVTLVSATASQGECSAAGRVITCNLSALGKGAAATITIVVTTTTTGSITNTAVVKGNELDPDTIDNDISVLTIVATPVTHYTLYSLSPRDDQLRVISLEDASTVSSITITLPGKTVYGGNGLATNPSTGQLWALLQVSGQWQRQLVTIDPATGVATSIGNTGDRFAGLAFDSKGTLYGVTGDGAEQLPAEALFVLSTQDAQPTFVMNLGRGDWGESIAFNPDDGRLYHISGGDGDYDPDTDEGMIFEYIDLNTRTTIDIPITGTALVAGYVQALVYYEVEGVFLWKDGDIEGYSEAPLFRVTARGVPTLIGLTDHDAKGLAVVTKMVPPTAADLSLSQTHSTELALVGSELSYNVTVTNNGPSEATGVTLTDTLLGYYTFVSANASQGACTETAGAVTCMMGKLGNGAKATVTIVVKPKRPGKLVSIAVVTANEVDTDKANSSLAETATVKQPLEGDANEDGKVDIADLIAIGNSFGAWLPSDPAGDVNGDDWVDLLDLVLTGINFGATGPGLTQTYNIASASDNQVVSVFLEPSLQNYSVNGTATIAIRIRSVENLYAAEVHLSFPQTQLEVQDFDVNKDGIQIAPFSSLFPFVPDAYYVVPETGKKYYYSYSDSTGGYFIVQAEANNSSGTISYCITLLNPGPPLSAGPDGTVLATITFRHKSGNTANITFANPVAGKLPVRLIDATGSPLLVAAENIQGATINVEVLPGDANGDGKVNALDITKVERIIAGLDAPSPGADANRNGNVDAPDITKVERIIAQLD